MADGAAVFAEMEAMLGPSREIELPYGGVAPWRTREDYARTAEALLRGDHLRHTYSLYKFMKYSAGRVEPEVYARLVELHRDELDVAKALKCAAINGCPETVRFVLGLQPSSELPDACLHYALRELIVVRDEIPESEKLGDRDVLLLLLDAGASVGAGTKPWRAPTAEFLARVPKLAAAYAEWRAARGRRTKPAVGAAAKK